MNVLSDKMDEALKSLSESHSPMNAISDEIKRVEVVLRKFEFNNEDVEVVSLEINGPDNGMWRLEYDFKNKRICVRRQGDERRPLMEHKFPVREYMVEHLPDLIMALKRFK